MHFHQRKYPPKMALLFVRNISLSCALVTSSCKNLISPFYPSVICHHHLVSLLAPVRLGFQHKITFSVHLYIRKEPNAWGIKVSTG